MGTFDPRGVDDVMLGENYWKLENNTLTNEFVVPKLVIMQIFMTLSHVLNRLLEKGHFWPQGCR